MKNLLKTNTAVSTVILLGRDILIAKTTVSNNSNQKNLKEWIAKYTPRLKSFIRGRVSSRDDADDILQDVFYQLAKNVDNAMNPIENISAWLYRVTQNKIINAETKKKEVIAHNAINAMHIHPPILVPMDVLRFTNTVFSNILIFNPFM